jgi:hypothetical protein
MKPKKYSSASLPRKIKEDVKYPGPEEFNMINY